MQITLEAHINSYTIRSYGPGEITITVPPRHQDALTDTRHAPTPMLQRVSLEILRQSAVISPQHIIRDWPPQGFEHLEQGHMEMLTALEPEVILLGTGQRLQWPDQSLLQPLIQANIGFEVMNTAAACRTYNVLMADGRRVTAALLMI